jgi:sigma-B regulation protein RsbU (phosphoserine phosphatase)
MSQKKILLVDDEEEVLRTMNFILNAENYSVSTALNGQEALGVMHSASANGSPYDLLVTDIQMPVMSGLELIGAVRKEGNRIPVLTATGYGDKNLIIELMRNDCTEYIDKPLDINDFVNRIRGIFDRQESDNDRLARELENSSRENIELKNSIDMLLEKFGSMQKKIDSAVLGYKSIVGIAPSRRDKNFSFRLQPFAELGGDFLDIKTTPHGYDILAADVAGHDMGSSYLHVLIKTLFDEHHASVESGTAFLNLINQAMLDTGAVNRFVTALHIRVNVETYIIELTSAGHIPLFFIPEQMKMPITVELSGGVMGMFSHPFFATKTICASPGDRLVLFSDGITNAYRVDGFDKVKTTLGSDGMERLITTTVRCDLPTMTERLWTSILGFCNYRSDDDMLLCAVELPQRKPLEV